MRREMDASSHNFGYYSNVHVPSALETADYCGLEWKEQEKWVVNEKRAPNPILSY